jgi:hypothetical protein
MVVNLRKSLLEGGRRETKSGSFAVGAEYGQARE